MRRTLSSRRGVARAASRWLVGAGLAALLLHAAPLAAQPVGPTAGEPTAQDQPPAPSAKERALEHWERGKEFAKQEQWGEALAEFREANRLFPTWSATLSVAISLKHLERYDEALDTYAVLQRDFSDRIPEDKKQQTLRDVEAIRKLVGTIEIHGAQPGATITIDEQARGEYPLLEPLRVPMGSHVVRVFKEGYEPFTKRVEVAGGTSVSVAATLHKLRETGTLRVIELDGQVVEVVVDGGVVGKTGAAPLEVSLAPGKHVVLLRGQGHLGSPPASVTLRANEVSPLHLRAEILSASLRVVPTPFDALVSIDSVTVGRGTWDGRVQPGEHTIDVAAAGFLTATRKVVLARDAREIVRVPLERDPESPFWSKPPPVPLPNFVDFGTGVLLLPSFGGDVAGSCAGACSAGIGVGAYGALRGGYRLESGLGFGLMGGYMTAAQHLSDRTAVLSVAGLEGDLGQVDDVLSLKGLFAGAWIEHSMDTSLPIYLRLSAGGLFGKASDARKGKFTTTTATASDSADSFGIGTIVVGDDASFVFVTPEARVGWPLGRGIELYAGVEIPILIGVSRPSWSEDVGISAGRDGYGWFTDQILGSVLVSFVPGIGVRINL